MKLLIALFLLIASPVTAKDMLVSDGEQTDIAKICEVAARAPNITLELTAMIANWCVIWEKKRKEPPAEPKKD